MSIQRVAIEEDYVQVEAEYGDHYEHDEKVDALILGDEVLPEGRVHDHKAVKADHTQEPRARLQTRKGQVADPATPEKRDLFQVAVQRRHTQIILEERVQVPLKQHYGVTECEYAQKSHTRVLAHVFFEHYAKRCQIAYGADNDEYHRVVGEPHFVRKVEIALAM